MTGIPSLETLESKTLLFLQSAQRPLVSIRNLLRHLNGIESFATLGEDALIEFIDAHELFCFVRLPGDTPELFEPAVYLNTRVPTDIEMKAHMAIELDTMMKSLELAHKEATAQNNKDRIHQLAVLLDRAQQLRNTIVNS